MDAQHRHELHQNDLRKLTDQVAPVVEQNLWKLVAGLAAVLVVFIVGVYWYTASATTNAEGWTQFDKVLHEQNVSTGDFAGLAEKYRGTALAAWARLKEGDEFLKSGLQTVYTNRKASESDLNSARKVYDELLASGTGVTDEVRERALFGLARSLDALSDGNTEAATKAYGQLTTQFPNSIFAPIAKARITALENPDAKDFYAWFHKQDLKPKDPAGSPFKDPADGDSEEEMKSEGKSQDGAASEKPADHEQPATDSEKSENKPAEESKSEAPDKPQEEASKNETPNDESPKADAPKSESP